MPRSEFERALGAAEHRAGRAAVELARTRRLLEREDMAGAFGAAFAFSAEVEKLALLARVLPAYTGHPKAAELKEQMLMDTIPVEMGYAKRGWFRLQIPALLPKKESGSPIYIQQYLYPALRRMLFDTGVKPGDFDAIEGDVRLLRSVEMVDQNPIGKSSRSNPVTYIKAYDEIRKLFADQPYAQHNALTPAHFSFNVAGGRCEECQGEGVIKVSMQFMADVELVCEACGGKRFRDEVLEVKYRGRSIYDVLEMTVDDAVAFFGEDERNATCRRIVERLRPLQDVGLGYIKLGQSSSTLSGGESQRVKLASFLTRESTEGSVMFIFDEPTTGLHFHDISKLLAAFDALIERGHTIVIVEHNMDIIKCADWVIDLGPEAGDRGGRVVFEGTPAQLETCAESYTGQFLKLRTKL